MSKLDGPLTALRRLPTGRAAPGGVILGYHDVLAGDAVGMSVGRAAFERQLDVLDDLGLEIVSLGRFVDSLQQGMSVDGWAVLTFDDALLGVLEHAAPVLAERELGATVFTVTGHPGVEPPWWRGMQRTLDADELSALHDAGHELASHTVTHVSLAGLSDAQLEHELSASRDFLEGITGGTVDLLAYPSGHHTPNVRHAARACGYRAACTFLNGRVGLGDDLFMLPRLTMGDHMTSLRLRYHLLRSTESWPNHQLDAVDPATA